jgi:hypothetical protein
MSSVGYVRRNIHKIIMRYIILQVVLVCDMVFIFKIGERDEQKWYDSGCGKFIWLCLSCVLWIFLLLFILLFYVVFGASYELINCYLYPSEDDEDSEDDIEQNYSRQRRQRIDEDDLKLTNKQIGICVLFGFLGLLLQPLYLLFYIIYAMMQCYRRLPCWVIYASAY